MKRIVLWLMSTLTVVVVLFGYRTSINSGATAAASSAIAPTLAGGTTSGAPTDGSSGGTSTTAGAGGTTITVPSAGTAGSSSTPTATSPSSAAATRTGAANGTSATYTGATASTRWGDVQVAVTVTDGRITAVDVPVFPNGNGKDRQINARALPVLVQETITAQSADVDMVTGATVTSDGYLQSLQSALDQAGL
ncbi:FMN-binding protein [Nakamurella deserti]|uniref:FMN-binding protein n=1 Tax=Nakamurella deserti TaxID=2164074 RepID=UPI000DBE8CAD|nr:FMN-binding protein [Nakamurella deserti]